MRTAVRAVTRGESVALPFRLQVHLVAARYGQDPRHVAEWPADLFLEALGCWPATGVEITHLAGGDG